MRPFIVAGLALALTWGAGWTCAEAEEPPAATGPGAAAQGPAATDLASLVGLARRRHPTAAAVQAALRAAEARATQAGTWANPEVEFSYGRTHPRVADLAADRPYGVRVSQRVEWWSKRSARVAAAAAQVAVSEAESSAALLDLEVEVRLAAIALAVSRIAAVQLEADASLAREFAELVARREALGDIDRGEAARARLEATTGRLRHEAAGRQAELQLAVLRAWCGDGLPDGLAIDDALSDPPTSGGEGAAAASGAHPRIRAALEAERAAEAQVDAERHARIPDVTVGVFGDREWEKDTLGVTIGFEVPLWDRNSARIAEAEAQRAQRAAQRAAAIQGLERERTMAVGAWRAAAAEVVALRDEALPVAEEVLALRMSAFRGGDASAADVLDARRACLAVQGGLLDARRRHAEAQVRLLAATAPGDRP